MSVYDSKANYHPVSTLPGSLPNGKCIVTSFVIFSFSLGSYLLPGNGYYRYSQQKFLMLSYFFSI